MLTAKTAKFEGIEQVGTAGDAGAP